jgi:histidinol-phosphatase (PHP family)
VLDYHLHLWPHTESDAPLRLEQIADYCERAQAAGVVEVALTEHLFRFVQAQPLAEGLWEETDPSPVLRESMEEYWAFHARTDLDAYVELALEAKRAGLPVVVGLEVDHYRGRMDRVAELLSGYPFDVLLGSVHWVGAWRFDDLGDAVSMDEWEVRSIDAAWDDYTEAMEELAASGACDVLAHPDLIKVTGRIPNSPAEWWDRVAEAAASSGMAAELSSAGWRKPVGRAVPGRAAADALRGQGGAVDHRVGCAPALTGCGPSGRHAFAARRCGGEAVAGLPQAPTPHGAGGGGDTDTGRRVGG